MISSVENRERAVQLVSRGWHERRPHSADWPCGWGGVRRLAEMAGSGSWEAGEASAKGLDMLPGHEALLQAGGLQGWCEWQARLRLPLLSVLID